ncbi:teichoic acid D-Ala incorporation-associated protein DltX [Pediococcus inopinatus]|nr:teichoic acid D-Ala incorporation-associated protein DltX [Pediococcus inopinatus]WPC17902.1 teichoic acid D-Ala incorporation-associated protein DltX [Pediococcus inopinatus]WPC19357.1 teichoic acid D-Ala incorporation-associated protein DltX [Pediococcus inopinatus]WPP09923.1 teichoic acid D-Ala incorporation-associated protein DltX [Pediococcus inopinatus]
MKNQLKTLWQREWVKFLGRMFFYFVVFLILVYLYGYSGISGGTFIYNEF